MSKPKNGAMKSVLIACVVLTICGCATTKRDWQEANRQGTIMAYEQFLQKHPDAKQASMAKRRLAKLREKEDWEKADSMNTISGYNEFIDKHPQSKNVHQAKTKLEQLKSDQSWEHAKSTDTIEAYELYVKLFPSGHYKDKALIAIQKKREGLQRQCMMNAFEVVSVAFSNKEAMLGSRRVTFNLFDNKIKKRKEDCVWLKSGHSNTFVTINWILHGYIPETKLSFQKNQLMIVGAQGQTFVAKATAMTLADISSLGDDFPDDQTVGYSASGAKMGSVWVTSASQVYSQKSKVKGSWLFEVPIAMRDNLSVMFLGRQYQLPVSSGVKNNRTERQE